MDTADLNIQYNARKLIPNHAEYSQRWDELAAQYRNEVSGELDIPYGESDRSKFDLFPAASSDAPVCIYIHGGYWRSRDRKTFSHVARGLNGQGISIAVPSYDLAPNVSILHIIDQMRACTKAVWEKTGKRPVVVGNSAGGHLTGAMLATDWSKVDGAPDDLATHAFSLSGLFDLVPLVELDINDDLRLTDETARAASPISWPVPRQGLKFVAAVGADESKPFKDQSRNLADAWNRAGIETEYLEASGCNHFSIVDDAVTEGGHLFSRLVAMIREHATA